MPLFCGIKNEIPILKSRRKCGIFPAGSGRKNRSPAGESVVLFSQGQSVPCRGKPLLPAEGRLAPRRKKGRPLPDSDLFSAEKRNYSTFKILTLVTPPGAVTSTVSPAFLPSRALPMGDSLLIMCFLGSASEVPTRVYSIFSSYSTS